jgi:hypothetical protein
VEFEARSDIKTLTLPCGYEAVYCSVILLIFTPIVRHYCHVDYCHIDVKLDVFMVVALPLYCIERSISVQRV